MRLFDWLFCRKPRLYAISDLHLASKVDKPMDVFGGEWPGYEKLIEKDWKRKVRKNDIVVVAGDLSWGMNMEEAQPDLDKIGKLGGNIVVCRGNHDYWWKSVSVVRRAVAKNVRVLQNDACCVGNYVFCGCRGWKQKETNREQSDEDKKILAREVERMKLALADAKKIILPGQKLVVVMHYPPTNSRLEDNEFTKLFEENGVDFVIFGHLHGKVRKAMQYQKGKTKYFLTSCDLLKNKLLRIE